MFVKTAIVSTIIALAITACLCETPSEQEKQDRPEVTTPLGKVSGSTRLSHKNRTYAAFEGIPYAKPPVGPLRFKAPEPVDPWKGSWDATVPTQCLQTDFLHPSPDTITGDEDCLHINIYVPRPQPSPLDNFPVVVHIHAGAFMVGAGHVMSPDFLMDRELIFVTLNYRLNIFGFLSTEDSVAPGNFGLKDQVLALKWIQNNIASFGGNPSSVTLTGLSAGAASVHYHLLSPLSSGLFHRALANSGVATDPWALQDQPLQNAEILAQSVGCPEKPSAEMVECLRQRPYEHLIGKMEKFFAFAFVPFAPFAPVVEKGGDEPFIAVNPYYLLTQGLVNDVPLVMSTVSDEGLFPLEYLSDNLTTFLPELNEQWTSLAPFLLDFNFTLARPLWETTSNKIKDFYIGENTDISTTNYKDLVRMCSDRLFLVDASTAAKLLAKAFNSPVFYYSFGYPYEKNPHKTVAHSEDAMYFFKNYNMFFEKMTEKDLVVSGIMIDLLASFVENGVPRVEGVNWKVTGSQELTYLSITGPETENLQVSTKKELAPSDFWSSLSFLENGNLVLTKDTL